MNRGNVRALSITSEELPFSDRYPANIGYFFRFANLDQKLFWGDECITSVRVAGYQGELA